MQGYQVSGYQDIGVSRSQGIRSQGLKISRYRDLRVSRCPRPQGITKKDKSKGRSTYGTSPKVDPSPKKDKFKQRQVQRKTSPKKDKSQRKTSPKVDPSPKEDKSKGRSRRGLAHPVAKRAKGNTFEIP